MNCGLVYTRYMNETSPGRPEESTDTLHQIITAALEYLKNDPREWLIASIKQARSVEPIVSALRHVENGQLFILEELRKLEPTLKWYRGGTQKKWSEIIPQGNHHYFTSEELDTFVIDGGANGVFGRRELAAAYAQTISRLDPVVYSLTLDALIEGVRNKHIQLVSEHDYDLRVIPAADNKAYIAFCKTFLQREAV